MDYSAQIKIDNESIQIKEEIERLETIRNSKDFQRFYNDVCEKLRESKKEYEKGGELIDHDELFAELFAKYGKKILN